MNTKKTTKQTNNNSFRDIDLPEVIDMDTLAYASDDELDRHFSYLHSERERAARQSYDLQPWEAEISYVQREMQIRYGRRLAHDKYLAETGDEGGFFVESKRFEMN